MELGRPLRVVTPTLDGDVLTVLARAQAEFTPPQVHGIVGNYSVEGVRKSLVRLSRQGIVLQRQAGNAVLYRLNREHLAAPAVVALAALRDTFIERLRAAIATWSLPCAFAALFGSAARGTMQVDSDIDIFIARPDCVDADDDHWRAQLDTLGRDVTAWTGNDALVLEYGEDDVARGLLAKEGVLADIKTEGIRLAGPYDYIRRPASRGA